MGHMFPFRFRTQDGKHRNMCVQVIVGIAEVESGEC